MMKVGLERNGFITKFLYTGRKESVFYNEERDQDQLRYEKYLRSLCARHEDIQIPKEVRIGQMSDLGLLWKYYSSHGNIFLDDSSFYTELRRIDLYATTELAVDEEMIVEACLWSYAAVDLWVNEELAVTIDVPVYKPIQKKSFLLHLKKGKNPLFIRLENLGVRDTMISFGIQILERKDEISVTLPDEEKVQKYVEAEELLAGAMMDKGEIHLDKELPEGSYIEYDSEDFDFRKQDQRFIVEDLSGKKRITLQDYAVFTLVIPVGNDLVKRDFERIELRKAIYVEKDDPFQAMLQKIAQVESIVRNSTDGFAMYPMLARYALGERRESDLKEFYLTLGQIEKRMDCADFMICALIRFMKNYEISREMKEEVKRVMLGFRYWMDEEGQDGMCFWSENHSLMFYQAAYFFGDEYRDEVFQRSGKLGQQLHEEGRARLLEWLEDVNEQGYDEFNSGVYSPITFSALLNLVDYAEEDLANKSIVAVDRLVRTVCLHAFKGVIISPQGRVYRDALYPQHQALQALMHYMDPTAPYAYSEWLSALATSKYRLPEAVTLWLREEGECSYRSSNAVIDLFKTEDYMLTSVQSPRRDGIKRIWERTEEEERRQSFHYTKSLNERFHGTMEFEPGVLGYQQHLWYAALDTELVVFSNHPGSSCESTSGRPGYWYGNGITPTLLQRRNHLGMIYQITDSHPIRFTHLFWNELKFDRTEHNKHWLFGQKGASYIGLWCSGTLEDHEDMLFRCEKRCYDSEVAYYCICGRFGEDGSFEQFIRNCTQDKIYFDQDELILKSNTMELRYVAKDHPSQYVE